MTLRILGIAIFDGNLTDAVKTTVQTCVSGREKENLLVSASDAHCLVLANRDRTFKEILNSFCWNLPDGMPTVWMGRLLGSRTIGRCYGPDVFESVMRTSAGMPIRHFLCGGKPGVAEELAEVCRSRLGNPNCVGLYSPGFSEESEGQMKDIGEMINRTNADIVWIGMSAPRQQVFAKRLAKYVRTHFTITVGAAFDFHTGRVKQAPALMQSMGLEWLFRIMAEPRRLAPRYLKVVPLFLYYASRELVRRLVNLGSRG